MSMPIPTSLAPNGVALTQAGKMNVDDVFVIPLQQVATAVVTVGEAENGRREFVFADGSTRTMGDREAVFVAR